jgi:hyperosmotically inducible protein
MKKVVLLAPLSLLILSGSAGSVQAGDIPTSIQLSQAAPDNTGRNVRDRSGATLTPGDQSSRKVDLALTRRIRRAIIRDQSLSTTAHNNKVITVNGVVTLRGPGKSDQEKAAIAATAQQLAGANQVENHLEVAAH